MFVLFQFLYLHLNVSHSSEDIKIEKHINYII